MGARKTAFGRCLKDEMNLAEFPLTVLGKRPPKGVNTLIFRDEIRDPTTGEVAPRELTVTATELLGLPTSVDEEVLVGALKLTRDAGMKDRRVHFSPYAFLEELRWRRDGKSYRRLSESFDRWQSITVISNDAFYHKGKRKRVRDVVGIIDRWQSARTVSRNGDAKESAWFVWGDFLWESMQAGNLRTLDFDFWQNLDSPAAKRLFRLLDKRFYGRAEVPFSLDTLAYEKVGVSRTLHTGQVKQTLSKAHAELEEKGFCKTDFVKRGRGDWQVVYTDLRKAKAEKSKPSPAGRLKKALLERGVQNASEVLKKAKHKTPRQVEAAIENFDDRLTHGEKLTHRWLVSDLLHPEGYEFRSGYQSVESKRKHAEQRQANTERDRLEVERKKAEKTARAKREQVAYVAYLESLPNKAAQVDFFENALEACPMYRDFYERYREAGDDELASQRRREAGFLLWQKRFGGSSSQVVGS